MEPLKVAVLASGRGSNLAALLENIASGRLNARVVVVISDRAEAGALELAREHGIPAVHLSLAQFSSQEELDQALLQTLKEHQTQLVVLAGYLKKISPDVIRAYRNRILNIHPALLPAFGGRGMYGMKVHQAVLDYGCKLSGVTVHLVDEEYDSGPPVLQKAVPVYPDDTPETLAARVLQEEHKIYSEAVQLFAEGRVEVQGRKVIIKSGKS